MGLCTSDVKPIYETKTRVFWDVPGDNQLFDYLSMKPIQHFACADCVYILYDNTVDDISQLVRLVNALNKNMVLVRTKCDMHSTSDKYTIEQEMVRDVDAALRILRRDVPIFFTSKQGGFDNQKLKEHMMEYFK